VIINTMNNLGMQTRKVGGEQDRDDDHDVDLDDEQEDRGVRADGLIA